MRYSRGHFMAVGLFTHNCPGSSSRTGLRARLFSAKPHFHAVAKNVRRLGTNHELRLLSTLPHFDGEAISIRVRLETELLLDTTKLFYNLSEMVRRRFTLKLKFSRIKLTNHKRYLFAVHRKSQPHQAYENRIRRDIESFGINESTPHNFAE